MPPARSRPRGLRERNNIVGYNGATTRRFGASPAANPAPIRTKVIPEMNKIAICEIDDLEDRFHT